MRTKNMGKFVILSLIILFGMAISIEIATAQPNPIPATADNITDTEDDVLTLSAATQTCDNTDLHPELDIDTMVRSGQTFVIKLHEIFDTSSDHMYMLLIIDGSDEYTATFIGGFGVTLMNDAFDFWNGTGWGGFSMPAQVGSQSGNTLTINIPTAALTITSSMDWNFVSMYTDPTTEIVYVDISPNSELPGFCPGYTPPDDNGDTPPDDNGDGEDDGGLLDSIPGYELSISLSILILTIGIIYIFTKKNRIK